jgi:hypothetical protein
MRGRQHILSFTLWLCLESRLGATKDWHPFSFSPGFNRVLRSIYFFFNGFNRFGTSVNRWKRLGILIERGVTRLKPGENETVLITILCFRF